MRALICGSRFWTDANIVNVVLDGLYDQYGAELTIIQGGADGADYCAQKWWSLRERTRGWDHGPAEMRVFPANWPEHGAPRWMQAQAGHERNQRMLDEAKPQVVLAFKNSFDPAMSSGGTEHMARIARQRDVPVFLISRI